MVTYFVLALASGTKPCISKGEKLVIVFLLLTVFLKCNSCLLLCML